MCRSSPKQEGTEKTGFVTLGRSHPLFCAVGGASPFPPPRASETDSKEETGMVATVAKMSMTPACPPSSFMGGNMEITVVLNITATNRLLQDEETGLPMFKSEGCEIILVSVKTNLPSK